MMMSRLFSRAALTATALSTSACGPETNRLTPISNPSLYSVNQPVVQHTNYVLDLPVYGGGLPASEQGRLAGWFEGLDVRYGDQVFVQAEGYAAQTVREDVERVVGGFGLLLQDGTPVLDSPLPPGSVRVIIRRASASVPGCPIWEDPLVGGTEQTSTNYGCATNSNLTRMIADPNDLVLGQRGGLSVDGTGTKAIRVYRERSSNPTK
jgi:pilus assembly protein CpaD